LIGPVKLISIFCLFQHKISPVPSHEYGERFFSFLKAVMRGGDGGDTFLPKEDREKEEKGKEKEQVQEEKENTSGEAQPAEPSSSGQ
jgi:hypothetical protein